MMVAVAVVAVSIFAVKYWALSRDYWERSLDHAHLGWYAERDGEAQLAAYHEEMRGKYEDASRAPWLLVPPDPDRPARVIPPTKYQR